MPDPALTALLPDRHRGVFHNPAEAHSRGDSQCAWVHRAEKRGQGDGGTGGGLEVDGDGAVGGCVGLAGRGEEVGVGFYSCLRAPRGVGYCVVGRSLTNITCSNFHYVVLDRV